MDKRLSWNASKAGDVEYIFVDPEKVWIPDIVLYNK